MKGVVRIGTSGWHYDHWKGPFYPPKSRGEDMLQYYCQQLDTVEVNNSFYRLPTASAVKGWVQQTPDEFLFAVKASRYITHNRKLKEPKQSAARFLKVADGFGKKLGPILFQFPSSWRVNRERLRDFLAAVGKNRRLVFEFRNPTWHVEEIYRTLQEFNAAFCIFEIGGVRSPVKVTADFVYVRLHGPGRAYQGRYAAAALRKWAGQIEAWSREGRDVFFFFDNDQDGFAALNAVELRRIVRDE